MCWEKEVFKLGQSETENQGSREYYSMSAVCSKSADREAVRTNFLNSISGLIETDLLIGFSTQDHEAPESLTDQARSMGWLLAKHGPQIVVHRSMF